MIPVKIDPQRDPDAEEDELSPRSIGRKVGWGLLVMIVAIGGLRLGMWIGRTATAEVQTRSKQTPEQEAAADAWLNSNPVIATTSTGDDTAEEMDEESPFPPAESDSVAAAPESAPVPPASEPPPKPRLDVKSLVPFPGWAKGVDLPPPTSRDEVALGAVEIPDELDCVLYLLGGEIAARTKHLFDCEPIKDGDVGRRWRLIARGNNTSEEPQTLAGLSIHERKLHFRWEPAAAEHPAARNLRNCLLKLSAGPGTLRVALRKSTQAAALPVEFDRRREVWEIADPPPSDKVQVEFDAVVPPHLPQPRFLGSAIVPARGGEVFVEFGDGSLKLHVKTRLDSDSLDLTVTPWFQVAGQARPLALTPANFKRADAAAKGPAKAQLQKLLSLQQEFATKARLKVMVSLPAAESRVELITAE